MQAKAQHALVETLGAASTRLAAVMRIEAIARFHAGIHVADQWGVAQAEQCADTHIKNGALVTGQPVGVASGGVVVGKALHD